VRSCELGSKTRWIFHGTYPQALASASGNTGKILHCSCQRRVLTRPWQLIEDRRVLLYKTAAYKKVSGLPTLLRQVLSVSDT
jgi:hypothetical protein